MTSLLFPESAWKPRNLSINTSLRLLSQPRKEHSRFRSSRRVTGTLKDYSNTDGVRPRLPMCTTVFILLNKGNGEH